MAVGNHLAGLPDRTCPAQAADDVVQALLEQAEDHGTRVARLTGSFGHVATELLFHHVVVEAELLLFVQTDAVVTQATTAEAVHARGVELALGGVLGDVGDGDADAAGELDLGAGVVGHDGCTLFLAGPSCVLGRGCGSAVDRSSGHSVQRFWIEHYRETGQTGQVSGPGSV